MNFVSGFAGLTMLPVDFNPGTVNATAFAARRADRKVFLIILNKDESQSLSIKLPGAKLQQVLTADSLTAREAHILTGAAAAALVKVAAGSVTIPKSTGASFLVE